VREKIKNIFSDNDFEEILTKGFSFLLIRIGGLIAGYIFTYLIAINYGAAANGLIALSFTLLLCTSIFGRMGIDINIVRHFTRNQNENDKGLFYRLLLISFLVSSVLAIVLYLCRDVIIYNVFNKPQLEPYLCWVVFTIPLWAIVLICGGLYRSKKQNIWFAFLDNPGRFLLSTLILIFLLSFLDDALLPIKAHFFGVLILALIAVIKSIKTFGTFSLDTNSNSKHFLKDSFPLMLSGAILIFLGWADTIVLGIYETDKVIGVYNVALKIAALTSFSLHALNSILAPKIAKSYQNNEEHNYKKMIGFSTRLNFFITLFIVIFILSFQSYILGFFGEEFLAGTQILFILCIGQFINSFSGSVGVILQMTGQQKVYQNIVLIALAINIILNFALTPRYGAVGAAIATVISISFWNITGAIYLKRKLNIVSYFNITNL
jgi:O-antigen/teichoic acid export membrane protein